MDQAIDMPEDFVLPSQTVDDIIDKFDDIAVGYCFCRQRRSLLGDACATSAPTLNCFSFGKSARHTSAQGFAKKISKEAARTCIDTIPMPKKNDKRLWRPWCGWRKNLRNKSKAGHRVFIPFAGNGFPG